MSKLSASQTWLDLSLEDLARNKDSARKDLEVILTSFETYANGLSGSTLDGIREEQFFAHIKYLKDAVNLYKNQSETYTSNLLDKIIILEKRQDQVDI